jgi:hypothetical protein
VRRVWRSGQLAGLADRDRGQARHSVVMGESERHMGEAVRVERRLYLSRAPAHTASMWQRAIRAPWGIEKGRHWGLDVGHA